MEATWKVTNEAARRWIAERREEHAGYYGTPAGRESIRAGHVAPNAPGVIFSEVNPHYDDAPDVALGLTEGPDWAVWVRSSGSFLFIRMGEGSNPATVIVGGRRHAIQYLLPDWFREEMLLNPSFEGFVLGDTVEALDQLKDEVDSTLEYQRTQRDDLWPWETTT